MPAAKKDVASRKEGGRNRRVALSAGLSPRLGASARVAFIAGAPARAIGAHRSPPGRAIWARRPLIGRLRLSCAEGTRRRAHDNGVFARPLDDCILFLLFLRLCFFLKFPNQ